MEIKPCPMIQFCLWKELVCYTNMSNPKVACPTYKKIQDIVLHNNKGKWVKVGGYYTPGGDPVWKCSNCGKGVHVYGIEANTYQSDIADGQWITCPNCGAIMEEE